jgi:flagellar basal-body rod protein FlgC
VVEEMADMISASRSYQNNVEVLNTSRDMLLNTLKLGSS